MTFALLLVCFFLSGFSALLYETAWTREFVFGTSELAVVAVLAAYMGGLALGAALAARFVTSIGVDAAQPASPSAASAISAANVATAVWCGTRIEPPGPWAMVDCPHADCPTARGVDRPP
jgi:hypothetical protein